MKDKYLRPDEIPLLYKKCFPGIENEQDTPITESWEQSDWGQWSIQVS